MPGGEGAEVVYPLRTTDTLAKSILEGIGDAGQLTRKYYQRRLPENPSKDYYYIMRETPNTTSLLIEYGFIDNPRDVTKLQNNLLDYAEAVVKAVAKYIGVPYVNPSGVEENVYVVQKGDSLYSIAQRFNTTVDTIKRLNNLTSNTLQVGQVLIISESTISPGPSNYITYTVKSGDSLWKIANQYNTTTATIKSLNNLSSNTLQIGQQLKIPTTSSSQEPSTSTNYTTYTVKSGDSLWKIANQFGVSVNDIVTLNNLGSNVLQIGQQLKIPTSSNNSNTTSPSNNIIYTVQNGDSLWKISQKYNVPVSDIISTNNLTTTLLKVGQQLKIPTSNNNSNTTSSSNNTEYVVKSGDSLWLIANRYNTTVNAIKNLNNLTSNTLQIGQVLRIPQ